MNKYMLKFQPMPDNAKLKKTLAEFAKRIGKAVADVRGYAFSLPSGFTCGRVAKECLTYANRETGRVTYGKHTEFNCFSAMDEHRGTVRRARWHNYEILKSFYDLGRTKTVAITYVDMANLLNESLPKNADLIRVHVGGEFPGNDFGHMYMRAWFEVARINPDKLMYAYTKNAPTFLSLREELPANFNMTMSRGGLHDHLIDEHGLKNARVVFHPDTAEELGLEIDHDDSHAMFTYKTALNPTGSFALLLHGTQRAGSSAAAAKKRMTRENIKFSYSKAGK